jgi:hypothetical protein
LGTSSDTFGANMPATSAKQKKFMDAAANNPAFAKKVGVPVKVAKEFSKESKGLKFKEGGDMKHSDMKMDKKVVKKAVGMHEKQLHGGKKSDMTKLARGGGIEAKGKTKGTMVKMARGGGIEVRGKTKGKMLASGGKC